MIGVEERDTKSGIHVFRIHYTADPMKRNPQWQEEAARGMVGGKEGKHWKREMEIDWTVASGLPVYGGDFVREWHVAKDRLRYDPLRPLVRGWDLGATHVLPACCIGQLDSLGRLNILAEMVAWDGRGAQPSCSIPTFADNVIVTCNELFGRIECIDYCDPAGWTKSQTDEKSAIDILNAKGIHPRRGPMTFTDRKRGVEERLNSALGGRAALLIDPCCTMLIEGLAGAYKYEEVGETGRYKPTVDKNAWSHIANAFEYLVGGVYTPRRDDEDDERPRKRKRGDSVTGY